MKATTRIVLLTIAFAASRPLLACDFCMLGQGISPYLTATGRGLTLNVNYTQSDGVYDKATEVSSGNKKEGWLIYSLTGFYAVTERLNVMVTLPYTMKTNLDYSAATDTSDAYSPGVLTNGIGDLTVTTRYTLFTYHTLESTLTLGAVGGVKFPTGSTQNTDVAGRPVDRHALPGTGSFDFPFGYTAAYAFGGRYMITSDAIYTLTTNGKWSGDPHRYGNSLNYNIKGFYKITPQDPGEKSLFGFAGISGQTTGQERGVRDAETNSYSWVENPSSGGTVLFWDLGMYANLSSSVTLNAGFSKAFYHYMHYDPAYDADPAENYKLDVALTYSL
jgi:hypothetical protein